MTSGGNSNPRQRCAQRRNMELIRRQSLIYVARSTRAVQASLLPQARGWHSPHPMGRKGGHRDVASHSGRYSDVRRILCVHQRVASTFLRRAQEMRWLSSYSMESNSPQRWNASSIALLDDETWAIGGQTPVIISCKNLTRKAQKSHEQNITSKGD